MRNLLPPSGQYGAPISYGHQMLSALFRHYVPSSKYNALQQTDDATSKTNIAFMKYAALPHSEGMISPSEKVLYPPANMTTSFRYQATLRKYILNLKALCRFQSLPCRSPKNVPPSENMVQPSGQQPPSKDTMTPLKGVMPHIKRIYPHPKRKQRRPNSCCPLSDDIA